MESVLPAKSTVLVHLKSVGGILFVFHCVVVALLALCACKSDLNSHNGTSIFNVSLPLACFGRLRSAENRVQKKDLRRGITSVPHKDLRCQDFFAAVLRRFAQSCVLHEYEPIHGTTKNVHVRLEKFFSERNVSVIVRVSAQFRKLTCNVLRNRTAVRRAQIIE